MKKARASFKQALKECKDKENQIRNSKLLNNLRNKNYIGFWKEVHSSNSHNINTQQVIDGKNNINDICNLFSNKYRKIFDRKSDSFNKNNNLFVNNKQISWLILTFSKKDISKAISLLNCSIGFDDIHTNHLKLCSELMLEVIAKMFFSFLIHNFIPVNMLRGILVPLIKDKFGDVLILTIIDL